MRTVLVLCIAIMGLTGLLCWFDALNSLITIDGTTDIGLMAQRRLRFELGTALLLLAAIATATNCIVNAIDRLRGKIERESPPVAQRMPPPSASVSPKREPACDDLKEVASTGRSP